MKKDKYEVLKTDIILFSTEDVITTSSEENETDGNWDSE